MIYHPRSEEDDKKANNGWLRGHTDFGERQKTDESIHKQPSNYL
jgi:hypothetical protein